MTNTGFEKFSRQAVSMICVALLLPVSLLIGQEPVGPSPAAPPDQAPPQAQLLSPEQLNTLVAPVALYPDALLGQVLVAATYPLEIVEASQWLQQNRNLQGLQLVDAARQQNWDASIQALVVFPDVLNRLNSDIRWTTDLGNAFLAQQSDVMNAVQTMRARAQAAGKLTSNSQETVTTQNQGDHTAIQIQPADPQVVYVPEYNPEYIWGPPEWGYYPPLYYPAVGFGFGFYPGIYIGSFFGGLGWGGWGWSPNWFYGSIYQNAFFFNRYGFGRYGWHGGGFRGGVWAHDPGHRLGVAYPNRNLANRFAPVSRGNFSNREFTNGRFAGSRYATPRESSLAPGNRAGNFANRGSNFANRGSVGANGSQFTRGANEGRSFGRSGAAAQPNAPATSQFRGSNQQSFGRPAGGNAYRSAPSSSYNYGGGSAYRSAPSSNFSQRSAPSYRSNPSFGGGGSNRGSFGGGGGFRSSGGGGGGFHGGGGGGFHGGGGGGSHGGGGGHGGGHR